VPIERLRLVGGGRSAEARLPFRGASLSRHSLDERLLARAATLGATVRRGAAVRALVPEGVALQDGEVLRATHVVLATGKHDLRGAMRPRGTMLGLKMHLDGMPPALARTVELRLFPGGYAGLEPVEGGRTNLCLAVEQDRFPGWPALLSQLGLEGLRPLWPRPLAVAAIPYGFLHRGGGPAYRVGDQLAVIPSFSGDGIAIALHSARRVAAAILAGASPEAAHAALATELAPLLRRAALLGRLLARPGAAVAAARLAPVLVGCAATATRLHLRV
jgi:flavin-dependent dehydrogenase